MSRSIVLAPPLQFGDSIAFISPSNRLNQVFPERVERARQWFEKQGFKTKVFWTERLSENYETAIRERCEEIHSAFRDPSVKAIICTIGGETCNELLDDLDYDIIRQNPKIFCGYSDITILHQAFLSRAGLCTFYGPAIIPNFGEYREPLEFTSNNFLDIVSGKSTGRLRPSSAWSQDFLDWTDPKTDQQPRLLAERPCQKWLRDGHAVGPLLGGCLPSILQLLATSYAPDYNESILLLETPEADHKVDAPFALHSARRCMTDLRNAGILHKVAGIVIGRPFMYSQVEREAFEEMVLQQCRGTTCPILVNIDIGHTHPTLTLPLGRRVRIDSDHSDTMMVIERPTSRPAEFMIPG